MSTPQLRAPKGTFDLMPPQSEAVLAVRETFAAAARSAAFGYIETPAFEHSALFARGVGESTDVVTKEMYRFTTQGGDDLSLRPEGTASVVRAALEHHVDRAALPARLWYSGSFYRYERPQKGRYRHFSQVGAEVLGSEDPTDDAAAIVLAADAFRALGLTGVRVVVNSLGSEESRPAYRAALQEYLAALDLDAETRRRAQINPLRVLDDKRPELQERLAGAPVITDFLSPADRAHHDTVRTLLDDVGVEHSEDPRLVRGLDYYTRTLVEFVHDGLGAQAAVGGGGRYDGLSELLGGPRLPGVGWALGVDRTLLAMAAEGLPQPGTPPVDVYGIGLGEQAGRTVFSMTTQLRRAGLVADQSTAGRGLKGAMKAADRSGARVAVVIGERDLIAGVAQVKLLATGDQEAVPLDDVVARVRTLLDRAS